MPSALSVDLRARVVSAVAVGASCHHAAERFGVSVASVSRWHRQQEGQGHVTDYDAANTSLHVVDKGFLI